MLYKFSMGRCTAVLTAILSGMTVVEHRKMYFMFSMDVSTADLTGMFYKFSVGLHIPVEQKLRSQLT